MKLRKVILSALMITPMVISAKSDALSDFPTSKTIMYELNFNPMGNNGVFSFDNMQGKFWLSNRTVLRIGFGLDNKKNEVNNDDYISSEQYKATISEKSTQYTIKPGFEYRILKKSKVSPYIGAELLFQNKSSNANYKEYIPTNSYSSTTGNITTYEFRETKIDNAWRGYTNETYTYNGSTYNHTTTSYSGERSFSTFGANALLGSDFYLVKNMYFGFEVGLGYAKSNYKKVEVDISTNTDKINNPSYNQSNINFYYNSAIRFGVWF